jgi:hypothetical protein
MFEWIIAWATEKLTYKPDSTRFLMNVAVNSKAKNEARLTLYYLDGTVVRSTQTPGLLESIYRGLYTYKIERENYKTFDSGASKRPEYLNLVDWDWSEKGMSCTLVLNSSKLDALPCKLESR